MNILQKILTGILPRKWAESMEKESREWMVSCSCGESRSVWEMGGIRWKASGERKVKATCRACNELTWHTISRSEIPE